MRLIHGRLRHYYYYYYYHHYHYHYYHYHYSMLTFNVRVCHPNADSYRELSPKQIFQLHENEKRQYSRWLLEVEQGTFTPLVFTSTGGMANECKRFHSRLAELLALKKGDDYATTISWIRAKVSFAILRSALLCLEEPGEREEQPIYLTLTLHWKVRKPEFK